ncbi:ABC transporter permease [Streptomyces sp. 8L]|uniref:ABC transporter permease n=1 Tax=Streptomyces sp. 8L TaxID=2877242 RepID=UPI001CD5D73E|nr:ABC transporter permease [Streptomyces sp. 8L]MCA1216983.1 ABC transporter permease [Streptomyces sp. 8L]
MIRFAAVRVLQLVPMLLALSWISFALLEIASGDAAAAQLTARSVIAPTTTELARARHNLGLDQPLAVRYLHWLWDALHGNLGFSYDTGEPVASVLGQALPWTLLLVGSSLILTAALALVLGTAAGVVRTNRAGRWAARAVHALTLVLGACPAFVFALLAIGVFALLLGWLPAGGVSTPGVPAGAGQVALHLVLPAATLAGSHHLGVFTRLVETGVVEARDDQHVLTARALGLPRRTVTVQHILRTALVPFVARVGTSFGSLVGGSYAAEVIFGWPGMGRVTLNAALGHDYATLTGVVLLSGAVVLAVNLLADLVVAWLSPATREGRGRPSRRSLPAPGEAAAPPTEEVPHGAGE